MLTCEQCEHWKDGKCDLGLEKISDGDAYDCIHFFDITVLDEK